MLDTTDVGFLINKAWHMRYANPTNATNKALLFGFFAHGGRYVPSIDHAQVCESNHELLRRSDTSEGARPIAGGMVEVVPASPDEATPFLAEVEGIESIEARNLVPFAKHALIEAGAQPARRCLGMFRSVVTSAVSVSKRVVGPKRRP